MPKWGRVLVLAGVALALAWVGNWMLWGYFVWRPSLVGALDDADALVGFSMVSYQHQPVVIGPSERKIPIDVEKSYCRARANECTDGRLLLRLEDRFGQSDMEPEVDNRLLGAAWVALRRNGWMPVVDDPRYQKSGVPRAGVAIHMRRAEEEYLLLSYQTGELANDRYAYSEVLYRLDGTEPRVVSQIHFFLEIAGIEGLEWPILWPINFCVLLLGCQVLAQRVRTSRS